MAYALPVEVYEAIRKAVKDEKTAKEVAKAIEKSFEAIEEKAKEQKLVIKAELKDELRRELATKEDIALVRQEIETVYRELNQKIEGLRQEFRIYMKFIILFLALGFTLFNPQFFELIKSLLSLLK